MSIQRGTDPSRPAHAPSRALIALASAVLLLGLASTACAYAARGMALGGLFLDPFCRYSAVSLPGMAPAPLRFPDLLVAVDGAPLRCDARAAALPAVAADRRLRALAAAGAREATFEFARGPERLRVRRALTAVGPREVVWFWALYFVAGLLVAWSGLAVLAVSRTAAARAYALTSLSTYLFLATFFDYHTTRRLIPLFSVGTVWTGAGCLLLALHFPTSLLDGRSTRAATRAVVGGSLVFSLALASAPWLSTDASGARTVAGLFAPVAAAALFAALVARWFARDGTSRWQARVALSGMLVTLVAIALGVTATMVTGSTAIHGVMPLVIPLTPISMGWAIARHNVLDADLVLTRRLLAVPTLVLSAGVALAGWLVIRSGRADAMQLWLPIAAAAAVSLGFFLLARRMVDGALFPAQREFRPTIQLLAESLTGIARRDELCGALVDTVTKWLPSASVQVLAPGALGDVAGAPHAAAAALQCGQVVWTAAATPDRVLLVPMLSHATLRGVLAVASKRQGALFTEDDLALLGTIAALGAIALHNVAVVAELDATRRFELDATRGDKALTLGLIGAELSHEIAHPLQFLRGLLRRGARGALDGDDVEIGQEEIQRMERMLASLRRLQAPAAALGPVALAPPVARAFVLVREAVAAKRIRGSVDLPDPCVVVADHDGLVQVLSNLLRNACQAVAPGGRVGVSARHGDAGELLVDVWDDGPGVPEEQVPTLFHRWVTSRAADGGSGLGLSVAQDLVVSTFGWTITYVREQGRTCFRIGVPPPRVVTTGGDHRAEAIAHAHPGG